MAKILIFFTLFSLILSSCSSWEMVEVKREIASTAKGCHIEKHKKRDYYRLILDGKPYNQYWYGQSYVEKLKSDLNQKGQCL